MPVSLVNLEWIEEPRAHKLSLCPVPAGFPSPAEGEEEEPIDLSAWLMSKALENEILRQIERDSHSVWQVGRPICTVNQ